MPFNLPSFAHAMPILALSLAALPSPLRAAAGASPAGAVAAPEVPATARAEESAAVVPPKAARRPHPLVAHGETRDDPYYWLRDDSRKDPEVLGYLEAENAYTAAAMRPTEALQERLYAEMSERIQQDDESVPWHKGGYWYSVRHEHAKEYPIFLRRKGDPAAPAEVLLDANLAARGHAFYQVAGTEVSSDQRLLAFAEDTVSRRLYTVRIRDLATGELLADAIPGTSGDVAWANDNRTFFYVEKDPTTLLAFRVKRHRLGTDPASDPVVYEETDRTFSVSVDKTRSERWILVTSRSTLSTEVRLLPADQPEAAWRVFLPRERDHEYQVEDLGDRFFVRTNWKAPNFRLMEVAGDRTADRAAWHEVVPHREQAFVHSFLVFRDFLAIAERSDGLRRIRVKPLGSGSESLIASDEPSYVMFLGANPTQDGTVLRYTLTSLGTPTTTFDLDVRSGKRTLLKRDPIGDFDPTRYETERIWVTARDGARVPVSLVHRRGLPRNGTAPLLQYGYGSYGFSSDPSFNPNLLSLLDRGFVYALAHVRGGQEMGRRWYEDGKLLKKKNTFFDFVDVTEALVAGGYAARDKVFAAGGSAGGLLVGAVVNLRPDLYRGVVAAVPFVDVVTTMLDESIPLTTGEFDEWGNPKDRRFYDYMLSYSPYDQVKAQAYPAMLVTTGLWDSQVQYYEPAKWVAKLRATKTDARPLLLKTNLQAGHGGKSGRFERLRDQALQYAFFLHLAGIDQ